MTSDKNVKDEELSESVSASVSADSTAPKPATSAPPKPETAAIAPTKPSTVPQTASPATRSNPSAPPPKPFVAEPSTPVSMANTPEGSQQIREPVERRFEGELDEAFETALARIERPRGRLGVLKEFVASLRHLVDKEKRVRDELGQAERTVAFDGFRSEFHGEKLERDRRYGTVYTVEDQGNAYLVRLEMPRLVPDSALKRLWKLSDEMPDYDYSLSLTNDVLSIRGAVPSEALRRLSYVSPSFPADFMTRIEFERPVGPFRHRLRDKRLEIIVFKRQERQPRSAA